MASDCALYFDAEGIYAGIWMTYFWMMLLAPLLVWPIRRWGGWGVAIVLGLPWIAWPWLSAAEEVNYFWGHLLGWGSITGPSVLHATSFVVFGFLLGAMKRRGLLVAMVVVVLIWTAWLFSTHIDRFGWKTVWQLIAYQEYRRLTHPIYMAFGATGSLLFLDAQCMPESGTDTTCTSAQAQSILDGFSDATLGIGTDG